MEKIKELQSLCKGSVSIDINEHTGSYLTVKEYLGELENLWSESMREQIGEDIYDEMVKRNTLIEVRAYPRTPIGFYNCFHYDLEKAVDSVLNQVKGD